MKRMREILLKKNKIIKLHHWFLNFLSISSNTAN